MGPEMGVSSSASKPLSGDEELCLLLNDDGCERCEWCGCGSISSSSPKSSWIFLGPVGAIGAREDFLCGEVVEVVVVEVVRWGCCESAVDKNLSLL